MDLAKTIAFGVKQTTDIWDILSYAKNSDHMYCYLFTLQLANANFYNVSLP